jgi:hypothetical protein
MNAPTQRTKLTKAKQEPMISEVTEMTWHKTVIRVYPVTDSQLEELTAGYNSLHLIFFGVCAGAALALWIAFLQTAQSAPERLYYFAGALVLVGLSIVCGINGIGNCVRASRRKKQLYETSIPIEK